jgi:hypothetical protein
MTNLTYIVFHRIHDVLKFTGQNKSVELKKVINLKKYTQKNMLQNIYIVTSSKNIIIINTPNITKFKVQYFIQSTVVCVSLQLRKLSH